MSVDIKKEFLIETIVSREERHYCAYLFRWLLHSGINLQSFLPKGLELGNEYRLFYEYALVREYLYSLKRIDSQAYNQQKDSLNQQLFDCDNPLPAASNDVQKKKTDLAIQTQINGKTMVYLVEAKFEEGFNLR